jgi:hypothetical protein
MSALLNRGTERRATTAGYPRPHPGGGRRRRAMMKRAEPRGVEQPPLVTALITAGLKRRHRVMAAGFNLGDDLRAQQGILSR